jgi:Pyruvate/2-oxoacid:ferredoxin oxidoreductase delta subunit
MRRRPPAGGASRGVFPGRGTWGTAGGWGRGPGRAMRGRWGSELPQAQSGGRQDAPESLEALKERLRIMHGRLAELKQRTRSDEPRARGSRLVASVIAERCTGCRVCQKVCPTGAIAFVGSVARVQTADCRGCSRCVEACPQEAIVLRTT